MGIRNKPSKNNPVTITGIIELDKKLSEMKDSLVNQGARKATREVGKMVRDQAKALAPEDTGELVASITVRAAKLKRRKGSVGVSVGNKLGHAFKGDAFYGGMMEFGTDEREHRSGKSTGRIEQGKFDYLRHALYTFPNAKQVTFQTAIRQWLVTQDTKTKRIA